MSRICLDMLAYWSFQVNMKFSIKAKTNDIAWQVVSEFSRFISRDHPRDFISKRPSILIATAE